MRRNDQRMLLAAGIDEITDATGGVTCTGRGLMWTTSMGDKVKLSKHTEQDDIKAYITT